MSIEALNWALNLKLDRPALKSVLIGLANHANPTGAAWPSVDRLSLYTGYSTRAVQRSLKELCERGILTMTERPGTSTVYVIVRGDSLSGVTGCRGRGDTVSPEPLLTNNSKEKSTRASRLPEDWQPNAALLAWAAEKYPQTGVDHEADKFRDYWKSTGGAKLDWDAAFRNWVRNARPVSGPRPGNLRHSPAAVVTDNRDKLRRVLDDLAGHEASAPRLRHER
jgi:hypothetical protein